MILVTRDSYFLQKSDFLMSDNKLFKDAIFSYLDNQKIDAKKYKLTIIKENKSKGVSLVKATISTEKHKIISFYLKKYYSIENAKIEFEFLEKTPIFEDCKDIVSIRGLYIYKKIIIFRELIGQQLIHILNSENQTVLDSMFYNLGRWLYEFHNAHLNLNENRINMKSISSFKNFLENEYENYLNTFSHKFLDEFKLKESEKIFSIYLNKINIESPYGICHGDFCFQNLIINKKENIVNIIDFEKCSSSYQYTDIAFFCAKLKLLQIFFPKKKELLDNLEFSFLEGYKKKLHINQNLIEILRFVYLHRINAPLSFKFFLNPLNLRVLIFRKRYSDLITKEITRLKEINI